MATKTEEIIFSAIDELNLIVENRQIEKSLDAKFIAEGSEFDSLKILTFIMILEDKLKNSANLRIDFVSEVNNDVNKGGFQTFGDLAEFINSRARG